MRQELFERRHQAEWEAFRGLLDRQQERKRPSAPDRAQAVELPRCYRRICNHYALARSRGYSPALINELHHLVLQGHRQLYRRSTGWLAPLLRFLGGDFPRAVRRHHAYFLAAAALFLLPGTFLGLYCYADPDLIYSVLSADQVADMESMYDPANRKPGRPAGRDSDTDLMMFGFYIQNNIGIGFRTFAAGILLGLGTVLTLIFNGVVLGSVAGHLSRLGYHDTFWSFVSGHGALELTAIVICGAAGLMLGRAVLAPGREPRVQALRNMAGEAVKLVMGAALMLLLAALVEAFWSSSGVGYEVKYAAAAGLWLMVIVYLALVGGGRIGPR